MLDAHPNTLVFLLDITSGSRDDQLFSLLPDQPANTTATETHNKPEEDDSDPASLLTLFAEIISKVLSFVFFTFFSMTLPSYRHDRNENNDVHSLSDITEEIHRTDRTVSNESKQQHQQTQEEHSGTVQHGSRSPVRRVLLTFTLAPTFIHIISKLG